MYQCLVWLVSMGVISLGYSVPSAHFERCLRQQDQSMGIKSALDLCGFRQQPSLATIRRANRGRINNSPTDDSTAPVKFYKPSTPGSEHDVLDVSVYTFTKDDVYTFTWVYTHVYNYQPVNHRYHIGSPAYASYSDLTHTPNLQRFGFIGIYDSAFWGLVQVQWSFPAVDSGPWVYHYPMHVQSSSDDDCSTTTNYLARKKIGEYQPAWLQWMGSSDDLANPNSGYGTWYKYGNNTGTDTNWDAYQYAWVCACNWNTFKAASKHAKVKTPWDDTMTAQHVGRVLETNGCGWTITGVKWMTPLNVESAETTTDESVEYSGMRSTTCSPTLGPRTWWQDCFNNTAFSTIQ